MHNPYGVPVLLTTSRLPPPAHPAEPGRVPEALLGGRVRVGPKDDLHLDRGDLARSAQPIERARDTIEVPGFGAMSAAGVRSPLAVAPSVEAA